MSFSDVWDFGFQKLIFSTYELSITHECLLIVVGVIICMLSGYLIGSISPSIIISAKYYNDDIRRHGSGNAGMTNVMRTYGKKMAAITFGGDFIKAVISTLIGRLVFGYYGALLAGFFCFLGHIFPCYYKFKGGKGVVTACGLMVMTDPLICLKLLLLFVVIVAVTKYISAGSVICMLVYSVQMYNKYNPFNMGIPTLTAFAMGLLCAFAHRENLKRIFKGEERKFTFKVKDKKPVGEDTAESEE